MTIRKVTQDDTDRIGEIAEASDLFPADYLPDMIAPAFNGAPDHWLLSEDTGQIDGFAFARPEEMADGVWNILAIAVSENARGNGVATRLLREMETSLDARMIIIETTQLPEQLAARKLYQKENYEEEGRVRDYYANGEDKVIFRKVISWAA